MSLAEQVRDTLRTLPAGKVISSKSLHRLSPSNQQVDKATSRLYKGEGLLKLRNGLFYRPQVSEYFGVLPPGEDDLIRSLKNQYKALIGPSGELAAYELGLTHKLPETVTYESDKRISPIDIDGRVINFRKVDHKKLAATNARLFQLFKALEFLFKEEDGLSFLQRQRASRLLNRFSAEKIDKALAPWPRWFQGSVKNLLPTTVIQYISGLSAFNIPYEGKQVDWHQLGMFSRHRFHIVGLNYYSAPGLEEDELFECGDFLASNQVELVATLCAKPLRAIKDVLFNTILQKGQYPNFFMLNQFVLDVPKSAIIGAVNSLKNVANEKQVLLLNKWLEDNELD